MSSDTPILVDPPPLDPPFFSTSSLNTVPDPNVDLDLDLDFLLNDNADFDFTFDDLYLPSETESFLIPNSNPLSSSPEACTPVNWAREDCTPVNCVREDCVVCADGEGKEAQGRSPERGVSSGMVSSQGSGGGGSGLSEDMNSPSPCSQNPDRSGMMKRKKDQVDVAAGIRTPKLRKSVARTEENDCSTRKVEKLKEDVDEKRTVRLMRNRESAQLSRQRKKHHIEEMEEKIRVMQTTITDLNGKISYMMAENTSLRQQLSSVTNRGMCVVPPLIAPSLPGMYPQPAMPYPWMPCTPYMVKPQGSQVPLVPIPRLKLQQAVSSSSAKVKNRDSKKVEPKNTRKVMSISLLGVLFFMLMFGVLVPNVKVRYDGVGDVVAMRSGYYGDGYHGNHYRKARLLTGNGHSNMSYHPTGVRSGSDLEEWPVPSRNASEPLVASLYVPRNNKLVKIEGNLIIHSVLSSEKAMASLRTEDVVKKKNVVSALAIPDSGMRMAPYHMYGKPMESQKALGSVGREMPNDLKATSAADGKLQQWFREGLAGPLLSSGMCKEVFQFDVSPASSGSIVHMPPNSSITSVERRNATSEYTGKNRRILGRLPRRIASSGTNITERGGVKDEDLPMNKTISSSLVVSVLVDPREAGDGEMDMDGIIRPKSISRIFVVVLMDSIKYVTYSCVLPRSNPGTHFVTT
ncbi:hypothetical protein MLD38_028832 [Melastoma candidum]|uniref:Uncharacterized protein n=1 Tax=Melastoma candidum TaxID=119954 RepID=A0ACB9N1U9_9MYRT|nr:hypothetical protein MLD38_028832 [Melastoma candidum]